MAEAVALDLIDAETVALSLEEGEQVALSFTEEVIRFEVLGEVGAQGPRGYAATVDAGTTTTGLPGSEAIVINVGDTHDAVFDFTVPRGDKGDQGDQGDVGTAATIAVGDVQTGLAGTDAEITNSGTALDAVFDFTIPRGDKGDAATITVGDVDASAPGAAPVVTNVGDEHAAVFDFTFPRGDTGPQGIQGLKGDQGDQGDAATIAVGDVEASTPGSQPSVANVGTPTDAVFEFVLPRGDTGPQGPPGLDTGFYRHDQSAPSAVWIINHNLGFFPAVTVQDSAGSVVYGDVTYLNSNSLTVVFQSAFGGYANLS